MLRIFTFTLLLVVLFGGWLLGPVNSPPPEKIAAAQMNRCSANLKKVVAASLLTKISISDDAGATCRASGIEVDVSQEGVIRLHSLPFDMVMVLTPNIRGLSVSWHCKGEPIELTFDLCESAS